MRKTTLFLAIVVSLGLASGPAFPASDADLWAEAAANGETARTTFLHCRDFVRGWLEHADPQSGLIPRNLGRDHYWNAQDAAADNYAFMVLTCSLLDEPMFHGRMREMLESEKRLTSRVGPMTDDFLFETQAFRNKEYKMDRIIFGASEYAKDGLLPLTEWLGPSPWLDRMHELADAILEHAKVETPVGPVISTSHEVAGEMLQVLSRLYWMTKKESYRDAVFAMADYFLFHALPTRQEKLSLDDHGCEIIGGLSEAYYLASKIDPERHKKYKAPMHEMLDRVLEVGRNENGYFYMLVNPVTGEVLREELTDNWGYDYNAYLTVAEVDDHQPYRDAVQFVLERIINQKDYKWEGGIAYGYADSLESGINLLNRVPVESGFAWVEHNLPVLLALQQDFGVVAGWHGDGNYVRTAIMLALWKTKGAQIRPWRGDVSVGGVVEDGVLYLSVQSVWPWEGKLYLDIPRHSEYFHIPTDYARLNQFPEWFTVGKKDTVVIIYEAGSAGRAGGLELRQGIPVQTAKDKPFRLKIQVMK